MPSVEKRPRDIHKKLDRTAARGGWSVFTSNAAWSVQNRKVPVRRNAELSILNETCTVAPRRATLRAGAGGRVRPVCCAIRSPTPPCKHKAGTLTTAALLAFPAGMPYYCVPHGMAREGQRLAGVRTERGECGCSNRHYCRHDGQHRKPCDTLDPRDDHRHHGRCCDRCVCVRGCSNAHRNTKLARMRFELRSPDWLTLLTGAAGGGRGSFDVRAVIDTTLPTGVTPQTRDSWARARERGNVVSVTVLRSSGDARRT